MAQVESPLRQFGRKRPADSDLGPDASYLRRRRLDQQPGAPEGNFGAGIPNFGLGGQFGSSQGHVQNENHINFNTQGSSSVFGGQAFTGVQNPGGNAFCQPQQANCFNSNLNNKKRPRSIGGSENNSMVWNHDGRPMKERAFSQHNEDSSKKIEQKDAEIMDLKQRCALMEAQLNNQQGEVDSMRKENSVMKQAIPQFHNKLCAAENEVKRLQEENRQKNADIQQLQQVVFAMGTKMQECSGDSHSSYYGNSFQPPPPPPNVF